MERKTLIRVGDVYCVMKLTNARIHKATQKCRNKPHVGMWMSIVPYIDHSLFLHFHLQK